MMFVTTRTPILREGHPVSFSHSAGSPSSLNARAAGNAGTEDADISSLLRMLAVCVVAMLAGAGNYREIAGHAADIRVHSRGAESRSQPMAGSGGSQGLP